MRKVVGYLLMTLDGVVEDPGAWLEHFDEDMTENMVEVINAQDAVLLGRRMYQQWATYWPTATDEPLFANFINNVSKYIVSTTLSSVDEWQPATLIKGDVFQEIAQLKQQPGKNIGAHGSITLVHSLLEQGLLDELVLIVSPVLVGSGRRLLKEGNSLKRLKLVSSKPTRTGALILTYQPIQH
jgi:dihydrofolate reductase